MATRWNRYFERQQEDPAMKYLVERELATLRLGTAIARMRGKRNLTQTELAARAGMSASKISAIESSPKNIELATLIRIATALEYQFRPAFVPAKTNRPAYAATARPRHGRTKKPSNARSMSASALRLRMKPVASSRQ